ncbi:hypothetical protein Salat_0646200 [Sesamum alatum]|uniref:Uncharacterized protein n=1 Tax=Sesamum alatum TaxID=300844 RepID=A0AAE1YSF5_9LAMI|nr:hypothetical protein Salat_0646200 [Sesamum alatum]
MAGSLSKHQTTTRPCDTAVPATKITHGDGTRLLNTVVSETYASHDHDARPRNTTVSEKEGYATQLCGASNTIVYGLTSGSRLFIAPRRLSHYTNGYLEYALSQPPGPSSGSVGLGG